MKYYVVSPSGRTGSRRLSTLLHRHFNDKKEASVCYDTFTVNGEPPNMENPIRFMVSHFEKNNSTDYHEDLLPVAEVAEILKNAEDGTSVHSHTTVPLLDRENWVVIFSERKSKAEQIMSKLVGGYLRSNDPLEADKNFEPFSVSKEEVEDIIFALDWQKKLCEEAYPDHIKIFLEDSLETIEEKLMLKFDRNERTETANNKFISNHRYKDLIINYKEVFEWCGESYE